MNWGRQNVALMRLNTLMNGKLLCWCDECRSQSSVTYCYAKKSLIEVNEERATRILLSVSAVEVDGAWAIMMKNGTWMKSMQSSLESLEKKQEIGWIYKRFIYEHVSISCGAMSLFSFAIHIPQKVFWRIACSSVVKLMTLQRNVIVCEEEQLTRLMEIKTEK